MGNYNANVALFFSCILVTLIQINAQPQARPEIANRLGCFIRENKAFTSVSKEMTPRLCMETCEAKRNLYAGVTGGLYCVCGDTYGTIGQTRNGAQGCVQPCAGDPTQTCGSKSSGLASVFVAHGNVARISVCNRVPEQFRGFWYLTTSDRTFELYSKGYIARELYATGKTISPVPATYNEESAGYKQCDPFWTREAFVRPHEIDCINVRVIRLKTYLKCKKQTSVHQCLTLKIAPDDLTINVNSIVAVGRQEPPEFALNCDSRESDNIKRFYFEFSLANIHHRVKIKPELVNRKDAQMVPPAQGPLPKPLKLVEPVITTPEHAMMGSDNKKSKRESDDANVKGDKKAKKKRKIKDAIVSSDKKTKREIDEANVDNAKESQNNDPELEKDPLKKLSKIVQSDMMNGELHRVFTRKKRDLNRLIGLKLMKEKVKIRKKRNKPMSMSTLLRKKRHSEDHSLQNQRHYFGDLLVKKPKSEMVNEEVDDDDYIYKQERFHMYTEHLGCFKMDIFAPDLYEDTFYLQPMPWYQCAKFCATKLYSAFGIHGGMFCNCAFSSKLLLEAITPKDECYRKGEGPRRCGSPSQDCSARCPFEAGWCSKTELAISLFSIVKPEKTREHDGLVIPEDLVGCFKENEMEPDMPEMHKKILKGPKITRDACMENCRRNGYIFAGLQNGDICGCGDHYGSYGRAPFIGRCNMACKGNGDSFCGGHMVNAIYKIRIRSIVQQNIVDPVDFNRIPINLGFCSSLPCECKGKPNCHCTESGSDGSSDKKGSTAGDKAKGGDSKAAPAKGKSRRRRSNLMISTKKPMPIKKPSNSHKMKPVFMNKRQTVKPAEKFTESVIYSTTPSRIEEQMQPPSKDKITFPQLFESKADIFYIKKGDKATIACMSKSEEFPFGTRRKIWYKAEMTRKKSIDHVFTGNDFISIDDDDGDLIVTNADPSITGFYGCEVSGKDLKEENSEQMFNHAVQVYVPTDLSYNITIKYDGSQCNHSLLSHKAFMIMSSFCRYGECKIRHIQILKNCTEEDDFDFESNMIISFVLLLGSDFEQPTCGYKCVQKSKIKSLNELYIDFNKFIVRDTHSTNILFENDIYPMAVSKILLRTCQPGHVPHKTICLPCPPGSFRNNSEKFCSSCKKNTYQSLFGASSCIPCPFGKKTHSKSSTSKKMCKLSWNDMIKDMGFFNIDHVVEEHMRVTSFVFAIGVLFFLVLMIKCMSSGGRFESDLLEYPDNSSSVCPFRDEPVDLIAQRQAHNQQRNSRRQNRSRLKFTNSRNDLNQGSSSQNSSSSRLELAADNLLNSNSVDASSVKSRSDENLSDGQPTVKMPASLECEDKFQNISPEELPQMNLLVSIDPVNPELEITSQVNPIDSMHNLLFDASPQINPMETNLPALLDTPSLHSMSFNQLHPQNNILDKTDDNMSDETALDSETGKNFTNVTDDKIMEPTSSNSAKLDTVEENVK